MMCLVHVFLLGRIFIKCSDFRHENMPFSFMRAIVGASYCTASKQGEVPQARCGVDVTSVTAVLWGWDVVTGHTHACVFACIESNESDVTFGDFTQHVFFISSSFCYGNVHPFSLFPTHSIILSTSYPLLFLKGIFPPPSLMIKFAQFARKTQLGGSGV